MSKKYRDIYADHCIRHPKDHVSYSNFRWRVRNRGEKLAIRLGKLEPVPETAEKISQHKKEKRSIYLYQQQVAQRREKKRRIKRIVLGIALFLLGLVIGRVL